MGQLPKEKPKLLIVEDDYANQKFLDLFLSRYFEVDSCDSSETFYEFAAEKKYDLYLIDISIKGKKNGLDLIREIKFNPKSSSIPVVCYTAHAFQRDRLNALDAGCDVYISKPSNIYTLQKVILQLVERNSSGVVREPLNPEFVTA
ncbi:MAG: DNA-binding response regulator [Ignavibacteria bacterium]|nr:MAG: DNA-binding response regulator [Ignavibacteria bacterium]KAF0161578.1 MAG: DNA-binding response regulator [Ignavibacteria bacterium]